MKIRDGQSVRFRIQNGEVVISPMGAGVDDGTADSAGPDKYERAITEMMAKDRPERSCARGAASGKSKLERLWLK